ncbi:MULTISPECIES: PEP-CTERM sorting domain-containing protein [unclassified Agarivorans]|uniref:PEP-CTERM sorting domain-containing protein n=1 Tax=unclassified Agarivorans TaxID=2636026 RepID=UPI003D7CF160
MKKILISLSLLHFGAQAMPFTDHVLNDHYNGQANGIPTANDHNDGVPDLFDAANVLLGTSYTSNADLDARFVADDQVFIGQGQHNIALIGLTAGNYNTLGVYTDKGKGQDKLALLPSDPQFGFTGDGSSLNPFSGAAFDLVGEFAWYLEQGGPYNQTTYYSENQLNGGWDHMMTFAMPELNGITKFLEIGGQVLEYSFSNAFLIGWEDLPYEFQSAGVLGDDDYDDMMYLVDFKPASTVPEPTSAWLMAAGLIGLGFTRRPAKS